VRVAACATALLLAACGSEEPPAGERPNVLFVSLDDVNDWVAPLNDGKRGKPLVPTPGLDRLAATGILFTNAHTPAPLCTPARASVAVGRYPRLASGRVEEYSEESNTFSVATLPRHFRDNGYRTWVSGKVLPPVSDPEEHWSDSRHLPRPDAQNRATPLLGPLADTPRRDPLDWGVIDLPESELHDRAVLDRALEFLHSDAEGPFFLGVGFHLPHLPWYLPAETRARYDLPGLALPAVPDDDLDDVPAAGRELAWRRPYTKTASPEDSDHARILRANAWVEAVAAYVAATRYADALVDELLGALASSAHAHDTIVVLWSDHGWHLGGKHHWRKRTLWEESTRVPLLLSGAPLAASPRRIERAVSLVDLYPTLVELCGLPRPAHALDGRSLLGLVRGAASEHPPALTVEGAGNASVRTDRWRYIRYADGTRELYDHERDPAEFTNLAETAPAPIEGLAPEFARLE